MRPQINRFTWTKSCMYMDVKKTFSALYYQRKLLIIQTVSSCKFVNFCHIWGKNKQKSKNGKIHSQNDWLKSNHFYKHILVLNIYIMLFFFYSAIIHSSYSESCSFYSGTLLKKNQKQNDRNVTGLIKVKSTKHNSAQQTGLCRCWNRHGDEAWSANWNVDQVPSEEGVVV